MKRLLLAFAGLLLILSACNKVKTYGNLPEIADGGKADSLKALRAWVEDVAIVKRDSMRRIDSIINAGGLVDTTSLFHRKNMMIAIVEANDHYFPNVLCYKSEKGNPVFDLAFPFSANLNINPGTGKPYVFYNPQQQAMVKSGMFRMVQNSGVKVGLSLLGNHDAAGWANFATLEEATDFAQIVAIEVRKQGYDAVLSDDEYSQGVPVPNSYAMVMSEIKRLLPDIYLCYYSYGNRPGTWEGKQMGQIADAVFMPFYPQYADNSENFPNSKTFSSTSETGGSFGDVADVVARSRAEGRGGFMFYNVCGRSSSPAYYAEWAKELKGVTLKVEPGCLNPNEVDFVNGR